MKGTIDLRGAVLRVPPDAKHEHTFEISFPGRTGEAATPRLLRAESAVDLDAWVAAIGAATEAGAGESCEGGGGVADLAFTVNHAGGALDVLCGSVGDFEMWFGGLQVRGRYPFAYAVLCISGHAASTHGDMYSRMRVAYAHPYAQALVAYNSSSLAASLSIYEEALGVNPNDVSTLVAYGRVLSRLGRHEVWCDVM